MSDAMERFRTAWNAVWRLLLGIALGKCKMNRALADDLFQETFLLILSGKYPWDEKVDLVKHARRVMARVISNHLKKAETKALLGVVKPGLTAVPRQENLAVDEIASDQPDTQFLVIEKQSDEIVEAMLEEIYEELPPNSRARHIMELTREKIHDVAQQAAVLGVSERQVKYARSVMRKATAIVLRRRGLPVPAELEKESES